MKEKKCEGCNELADYFSNVCQVWTCEECEPNFGYADTEEDLETLEKGGWFK